MNTKFTVAVNGNSLGDWLCAAEMAMAGVRTCLIAYGFSKDGDAPELNTPFFPDAIFPPSSSDIIANRLGLGTQAFDESPFEPCFQVVTPRHRLDFFGRDEELRFGLERDVPEHAQNMLKLLHELDALGEEFNAWLENSHNYPPITRYEHWLWNLFTSKAVPRKFLEPFSETLERHDIPPDLRIALRAPLNSFAPYTATNLPVASAACLWRLMRKISGNGSAAKDLREPLKETINANGEVVNSRPVSAEIEGGRVRAVKLADQSEIEFQALLSRPGDFFSLLDSNQRELRAAKKMAGCFPRSVYHTMFFRLERDAAPEAMAAKVAFVMSVKKNLWGDNLMILSRSPRVPRWDTLAVTMGFPKGDMDAPPHDYVFESLQSLMPFLRSDQLEPEEKMGTITRKQYLRTGGLVSGINLVTPFKNLYLSFTEILPRLGATGMFIAARRLAESLRSG